MSGAWVPKLIALAVNTCPACGMALDLYARPINVRYLLCCGCETEYGPEWTDGYEEGKKAAPQPAAGGAES